MLDEYRRRRDQLYTWLADDPRLRVVKPPAPSTCSSTSATSCPPTAFRTSADLAQALLDKARVALRLARPSTLRATSAFRTRPRSIGSRKARRGFSASFARTPAPSCDRRVRPGESPPESSVRRSSDPTRHRARPRRRCAPQGPPPDLVVLPGSTAEIAAVVRLCHDQRVPIVPRGGGTGGTRAAPSRSRRRRHVARAAESDPGNRRGEPDRRRRAERGHGDLQDAVERLDSLSARPGQPRQSVIGGNIAECAGGPRAFKYGTTKRYVLGLEAVLPTGEIVETGAKVVKNVVGYDLTHLLVGSEGTLAIITEEHPAPDPQASVQATLRATFPSVEAAVDAVTRLIRRAWSRRRSSWLTASPSTRWPNTSGTSALAPPGTGALLLIEVDGLSEVVEEKAARVERRAATPGRRGPRANTRRSAPSSGACAESCRIRSRRSRPSSTITTSSCRRDACPELFALVKRSAGEYRCRSRASVTSGDGNIHVNIMVDPADPDEVRARATRRARALRSGGRARRVDQRRARHRLREGAVLLSIELSPDEIALMKRVKAAFDPKGISTRERYFLSIR